MPGRVAVLLQAVNVGGATIGMADLRTALAGAGYDDVETLLRSGNVVLTRPPAASRADVAAGVARVCEQMAGRPVGCIALDTVHLEAAVDENPIWEEGMDGARMLAVFSDAPGDVVDAPRKGLPRLGGGTVAQAEVDGVFVTFQWCEDGISKTPALAEFVRFPKGAVATARNRNTVEKLIAKVAP